LGAAYTRYQPEVLINDRVLQTAKANSNHHNERKDTTMQTFILQHSDSLTPLHLAFSPPLPLEGDGRKNLVGLHRTLSAHKNDD